MKIRFTVGRKLALGFGVLILAVLINVLLTYNTLSRSIEANHRITHIYNPSASYLSTLYTMISGSKMLVKNWVFIEVHPNTPDKIRLQNLHSTDIPTLHSSIVSISAHWDSTDVATYQRIHARIADELFPLHEHVMTELDDFSSYEDPMTLFMITPLVDERGDIMVLTDEILAELDVISRRMQARAEEAMVEMDQSFMAFRNFVLLMGVLLPLIALVTAVISIRSLVRPINAIRGLIAQMARGILPDQAMTIRNDEIGDMTNALNSLITSLKDTSGFAAEIGRGNFDAHFNPLSKDDVLGHALINMRNELKSAADEEARRKVEDEQRSWAALGVAKFSDILRKDNDNMAELSYNVISNLVRYLDAVQGGLFVVNDEDQRDVHIELSACYAYDRRKYLEKRIEMGSGLVGRCVQEAETIFMTDLPKGYITIASGLGEDTPRSLLIVPLVANEKIYGVFEIASLNVFQPYQIEFVEKIGESVASTISSVKISIRTQALLEQTRQQAEEMAAQEEEMRQNMEELQATQEESTRREMELRKALEELESQLAQSDSTPKAKRLEA